MYNHIETTRNITNNQLVIPCSKTGFTIVQNLYRLTTVGRSFATGKRRKVIKQSVVFIRPFTHLSYCS